MDQRDSIPSRPSILIVEDEALIASYIREVLEESGFAIVGVASSGIEALTLAADALPTIAKPDSSSTSLM